MSRKLSYDMSFEEEKIHTQNYMVEGYKWVADKYRNTYDNTGKIRLYEWEDINFVNTEIISDAARYFKQYGSYNDIDPVKYPRAYAEWWDRWEYRRKHGIALPVKMKDKSGGNSDKDIDNLWIPPKMVGHLNFGPITRTKDPDSISVKTTIANSLDQRKKIAKEAELKMLFAGLSDKKVAEITHDFPDFWDGHYHTWLSLSFAEKIGLGVAVGKARRKGFSYVGAWDAFDEIDMQARITVLLIAYDSKYMTKGDGIMNMVYAYSDFINLHTDWAKHRLTENETELQFGFRYRGSQADEGFLSKILALSAKDNPDCARGKMAKKIKYEECGTFPNLIETDGATKSSAESGGYTVGQSTYWGTVGSDDADYFGLSEIFYNPQGYDCLAFNNIHDKNAINTPCGLWYGQYQNYEGTIDKFGNSNKDEAKRLHEERKVLKYNNSTPSAYLKWVAERAVEPREAFNRGTQNIFKRHTDAIQARLDYLCSNANIGTERHGKLINDNGIVRLKTLKEYENEGSSYHPPVYDTNDIIGKNYDLHGCIIEYESPFLVQVGNGIKISMETPVGLYYIRHDPYATDKEGVDITSHDSLGVAYVYERTNMITPTRGDRLVASWIGRPETTDEYNEQLFMLAMYYRVEGRLLFENDRGQVAPYAKTHKLTRYLQSEPEMLANQEISGKTGRGYGFSIGKNIKRKLEGAKMLNDHLGQVNGNHDGIVTTFLSTIRCRRFLRELLRWNMKGNFDCISAQIIGEFQDMDILEKDAPELYVASTDDFWDRDFW